jgi:hypothetical protein
MLSRARAPVLVCVHAWPRACVCACRAMHASVRVCVHVCATVRARARASACVCAVCVCVDVRVRASSGTIPTSSARRCRSVCAVAKDNTAQRNDGIATIIQRLASPRLGTTSVSAPRRGDTGHHICNALHRDRHQRSASPGLGLRRDWAHLCHICAGTGLATATSAPGPGAPLPHLRRDWAHPCHICAGTRPDSAGLRLARRPRPRDGQGGSEPRRPLLRSAGGAVRL